jgi:hypothetical protein
MREKCIPIIECQQPQEVVCETICRDVPLYPNNKIVHTSRFSSRDYLDKVMNDEKTFRSERIVYQVIFVPNSVDDSMRV